MERDNGDSTWGIDRRTFLRGSLVSAGLAVTGTGQAAGRRTGTSAERPVVGIAGDPIETLNPFAVGNGGIPVLEAVYEQGVRFHPETNEAVPRIVTDVEVDESAVGTDNPALVAEVADGYTWHDGEPVTAEDVAFTAEYVPEHVERSGFLPTRGLRAVREARASDGRVEYVLDEKVPAWEETIVGQQVLPEHRWRGIDDPAERTFTEDGPVGAGAFEVTSVEFPADSVERSVTLSAREEYPTPDFLGDGPFVDGLRFEYFETRDDLADALFAGTVDVAGSELGVDNAVAARDATEFVATANPSQYASTIGFNLRRVPFDDLAFRRFLTRAWDDRFHVEERYAGFAVDGDYAVAPPLRNYRPAEPDAPAAEQFPFFADDGGDLDVEAARDFLRDADGSHDYTFGSVESSLVTGDAELRVDGELLTEAHTDNDGDGGQGPLVLLTSERARDLDDRSWDRWLTVLREIGVPVRREELAFGRQVRRVFNREDFDAFEIGINTSSPRLSIVTLGELFSADGADLDGTVDGRRFNAMGYTGAEDALARMETMDTSVREDAAADALQTIYEDCPVNVFDYSPIHQSYAREWTGVVGSVDGIDNLFTWLNIRPRVLEVTIDVKPGSDRNPVNPTSRGVIPVTVLNTEDVDPTRIDVSSLRFGPPDVVENGGGATPAHGGHVEDVDGDGDADLVVHFRADDAGFETGDGTGVLVGELGNGRPIRGTDGVTVVGRRGGGDHGAGGPRGGGGNRGNGDDGPRGSGHGNGGR